MNPRRPRCDPRRLAVTVVAMVRAVHAHARPRRRRREGRTRGARGELARSGPPRRRPGSGPGLRARDAAAAEPERVVHRGGMVACARTAHAAGKRGPPMEKTALLVIDAQQEYFAPIGKVVLPDGPRAVERIADLLAWARAAGVPVVHVVHESRRPNPTTFVPGSPALEIHPAAQPAPGEPVVTKHLPGSFTNTGLEEHLRRHGIEQVIVSGFMTQMCCDTTAREAAHRGFKVLMAADAMAAMPVKGPDGVLVPHDQVHRTHLGSLNGFLATVTTSPALTGGAPAR